MTFDVLIAEAVSTVMPEPEIDGGELVLDDPPMLRVELQRCRDVPEPETASSGEDGVGDRRKSRARMEFKALLKAAVQDDAVED